MMTMAVFHPSRLAALGCAAVLLAAGASGCSRGTAETAAGEGRSAQAAAPAPAPAGTPDARGPSAAAAGLPAAAAPAEVAEAYVRARWARDDPALYALVAGRDRAVKSLDAYRREQVPLTERARQLARVLTRLTTVRAEQVTVQGDRATVDLLASLPDGQALWPELLQGRVVERLSEAEFGALLAELERRAAERRLATVTSGERVELTREPAGWRVQTGWDQGVVVRFHAQVSEALPWTFEALDVEQRVLPGATSRATYRATNRASRPVSGRAVHTIEPPEAAEFVDIVQCFCFLSTSLEPGQSEELPVVYRLDFEVPDGVRAVDVYYRFEPDPGPKSLSDEAASTGTTQPRGAPWPSAARSPAPSAPKPRP